VKKKNRVLDMEKKWPITYSKVITKCAHIYFKHHDSSIIEYFHLFGKCVGFEPHNALLT